MALTSSGSASAIGALWRMGRADRAPIPRPNGRRRAPPAHVGPGTPTEHSKGRRRARPQPRRRSRLLNRPCTAALAPLGRRWSVARRRQARDVGSPAFLVTSRCTASAGAAAVQPSSARRPTPSARSAAAAAVCARPACASVRCADTAADARGASGRTSRALVGPSRVASVRQPCRAPAARGPHAKPLARSVGGQCKLCRCCGAGRP